MTTFVHDTFTDTGGIDLTSHVGETGASWTYHPNSGAAAKINDAGDRARIAAVGNSYAYASGVPASADYSVEAGIYVVNTEYNNTGVFGRLDPSSWTNYALRLVTTAGTTRVLQLLKQVGGTETVLGEVSGTYPAGSETIAKLEMIGTSIKAYRDGVEELSVSDSSISAAGRPGVRFRANNTTAARNDRNAALTYLTAVNLGGPTVHELELDGSVTPAGVLVKLTGKRLSGTVAPAGILSRAGAFLRSLAGTVAPAGALARSLAARRTFTSSVEPVGTLARARAFLRNLGSSVTPAGVMSRVLSARRTLTGTVEPSGVLRKVGTFLRSHASQVTPSGALAKLRPLALAGAVTASGVLRKVGTFRRSLVSQVLAAGTVVKATTKRLTSSVTPAGTLNRVKARFLEFVSSVAPSGVLGKVGTFRRSLLSEVPLTGSVRKLTSKAFTSSVTAAGVLGRSMVQLMVLASSVVTSGVLRTVGTFRRSHASEVVPTGILRRTLSLLRSLTSTVTPAGALGRAATWRRGLASVVEASSALTTARTYRRLLTGSVEASSTLAKWVAKTLTSTVTPTGLFTKVNLSVLRPVARLTLNLYYRALALVRPRLVVALAYRLTTVIVPARAREVALVYRNLTLRWTNMAKLPQFPDKRSAETLTYTFELVNQLATGETLSEATATITVSSASETAEDPVTLEAQSTQVSGTKAMVKLAGGLDGVTYVVSLAVSTNMGQVLAPTALLRVKDETE